MKQKRGSNNKTPDNKLLEKKIIFVSAIVIAVIALILFLAAMINRATTMRIESIDGEVTLEENGTVKTPLEGQRLKSGDVLCTKENGIVRIGLDNSKIVTVIPNSRIEIVKKGRKLDLTLAEGDLYFEVSRKLKRNESLNFHTNTMVVGIRGTSGHIFYENGKDRLEVMSGTVHVIATHPVTGEQLERDVNAGEDLTVEIDGDSIDLTVRQIPPESSDVLPDESSDGSPDESLVGPPDGSSDRETGNGLEHVLPQNILAERPREVMIVTLFSDWAYIGRAINGGPFKIWVYEPDEYEDGGDTEDLIREHLDAELDGEAYETKIKYESRLIFDIRKSVYGTFLTRMSTGHAIYFWRGKMDFLEEGKALFSHLYTYDIIDLNDF
ncbi:MAG: FecR family protein [Lachnospiraceae bacterium]|nr:FecR family protein [Lachnospiraceae bacterium]